MLPHAVARANAACSPLAKMNRRILPGYTRPVRKR